VTLRKPELVHVVEYLGTYSSSMEPCEWRWSKVSAVERAYPRDGSSCSVATCQREGKDLNHGNLVRLTSFEPLASPCYYSDLRLISFLLLSSVYRRMYAYWIATFREMIEFCLEVFYGVGSIFGLVALLLPDWTIMSGLR
jgi:hypothetical protein